MVSLYQKEGTPQNNKEDIKMKKYTRSELYAFVWRANTPQKIEVAKEWITKNVEDNELWEDLMLALSVESRNYYRAQSGRELI